jgi:DNA-binding NtrC family response regulator
MSKTIVWIDDNYDVIESVVRPLKKAGYNFIYYSTAREAEENIEEIEKADLIILDLLLATGTDDSDEEYGGIPLFTQLKNKYKIKVPIIVFTVVTKIEKLESLRKSGVAAIVHKPIDPQRLKEVVEEALNR